MLDNDKEWLLSVDHDSEVDLLDVVYPFPTCLSGSILKRDLKFNQAKYKSPHNRTPPPKAIKIGSKDSGSHLKSDITRFIVFYNQEFNVDNAYTKKTCMALKSDITPFTLEILSSVNMEHGRKGFNSYLVNVKVSLIVTNDFDFTLGFPETSVKEWKDYTTKQVSSALIYVFKTWQQSIPLNKKKNGTSLTEEGIDLSHAVSKKMRPLIDMHVARQKKSELEVLNILRDTSLYRDFVYFLGLGPRIIHTFKVPRPVGVMRIYEGETLFREVVWDLNDKKLTNKIYICPSSLQSTITITLWLYMEYISYYMNHIVRKLITSYNMDCKLVIHHYHRKLSSFSHPDHKDGAEVIKVKTDDQGYCKIDFQCKNRLYKALVIGDNLIKTKLFVRVHSKDSSSDSRSSNRVSTLWERNSLFHLLDRMEEKHHNFNVSFQEFVKDICLVCMEDLNAAYVHDYDLLQWREKQESQHDIRMVGAKTSHWKVKLVQWILNSIFTSVPNPESHLTREVYGLIQTIFKNNLKQVLLGDFETTSLEQSEGHEGWNMWIMLEYVKNLSISSSTSSYPDSLGKSMLKLLKDNSKPTHLLRIRTAKVHEGIIKAYQSPHLELSWHHLTAVFALHAYSLRIKDRKILREISVVMHEQLKILEALFKSGFTDYNAIIPCLAAYNLAIRTTYMQPYQEEMYHIRQHMMFHILQLVEENKQRDLETLCFLGAVCSNTNLLSLCEALRVFDPMEAPLSITNQSM